MADPYPTDLMNGTGGLLTGFAAWAFTVTNGLFFVVLLAAFCVVIFIATSRYTTERAFAFASFVGMIGALMLVTLNLISVAHAAIFIGLGVIGIVWMITRKDNF